MTVTIEAIPDVSDGNGVTTAFPVTFPADDPAYIKVALKIDGETLVQVAGDDYLLTGDASAGYGVSFFAAPPAGAKVVRYRETPGLQTAKFQDLLRFPGQAIHGVADRLARAIQDVKRDRVTTAPGDGGLVLPPLAFLEGGLVYFENGKAARVDKAKYEIVADNIDKISTVDGAIDAILEVAGDLAGDDNISIVAAIIDKVTTVGALGEEIDWLHSNRFTIQEFADSDFRQEISTVAARGGDIAALAAINLELIALYQIRTKLTHLSDLETAQMPVLTTLFDLRDSLSWIWDNRTAVGAFNDEDLRAGVTAFADGDVVAGAAWFATPGNRDAVLAAPDHAAAAKAEREETERLAGQRAYAAMPRDLSATEFWSDDGDGRFDALDNTAKPLTFNATLNADALVFEGGGALYSRASVATREGDQVVMAWDMIATEDDPGANVVTVAIAYCDAAGDLNGNEAVYEVSADLAVADGRAEGAMDAPFTLDADPATGGPRWRARIETGAGTTEISVFEIANKTEFLAISAMRAEAEAALEEYYTFNLGEFESDADANDHVTVNGIMLVAGRTRYFNTDAEENRLWSGTGWLATDMTVAQAARLDSVEEEVNVINTILDNKATVTTTLAQAATLNLASVDTLTVLRYSDASRLSPAVYVEADNEPSHDAKFQSADGKWFKLLPDQHHNALMFGCVGDWDDNTQQGTDDTARALAYITWVSSIGGGEPYFPPGKYFCTGRATPSGIHHNIHVRGAGPATEFIHGADGESLFRWVGSIEDGIAVTAVVSPGDYTLDVADTSTLSVGDYLYLDDPTKQVPDFNANDITGLAGEVCRVRTINSATQISVYGAIELNYTTAARVRKLNPCKHVSFADFVVRNPTPRTLVPGSRAISADYVVDFECDNVDFVDLDDDGVRLSYTIDIVIGQPKFQNLNPSNAYGVNLTRGCWSALIHDGVSQGCRHFVTIGSIPTEPECAHITITDCIARDAYGACYDVHPGGRHITFNNCHAYSPQDSTEDSTARGFQVRSRKTKIIHPTIVGMQTGVFAVGQSDLQIEGGMLTGVDEPLRVQNAFNVTWNNARIIRPGSRLAKVLKSAHLAEMPEIRLTNWQVDGDTSEAAFQFDHWEDDYLIENLYAPDITNFGTDGEDAEVTQIATTKFVNARYTDAEKAKVANTPDDTVAALATKASEVETQALALPVQKQWTFDDSDEGWLARGSYGALTVNADGGLIYTATADGSQYARLNLSGADKITGAKTPVIVFHIKAVNGTPAHDFALRFATDEGHTLSTTYEPVIARVPGVTGIILVFEMSAVTAWVNGTINQVRLELGNFATGEAVLFPSIGLRGVGVDKSLTDRIAKAGEYLLPHRPGDQSERVNNAMLLQAALGGGTVRLGPGNWQVSALNHGDVAGDDLKYCLNVPSNVFLRGAAGYGTKLTQKASSTEGEAGHVINFGRRVSLIDGANEDLAPVYNCGVSDLVIDGNRANIVAGNGNNLMVGTGCQDVYVSRIKSLNAIGYGFGCQRDEATRVHFEDIYVENAGVDGGDLKGDEADQINLCTAKGIYIKSFNGRLLPAQAALDVRRGWQIEGVYVEDITGSTTDVGFRLQVGDAASGGPGDPFVNTSAKNIVVKCSTPEQRICAQLGSPGASVENITCIGGDRNYRIRNSQMAVSNMTGIGGNYGLDINDNGGDPITDCLFEKLTFTGQAIQSLNMDGAVGNSFSMSNFGAGAVINDQSIDNLFERVDFAGSVTDQGDNYYKACSGGAYDNRIPLDPAKTWRLSRRGGGTQFLDVDIDGSGVLVAAESPDDSNGAGAGKPFSFDVRTPNGTDDVNLNFRVQGMNVLQAFGNRINALQPFNTWGRAVASVPSAAGLNGALIWVSDGDGGAGCLAVSDGTNWRRIALGAAISAT